MCHPVGGSVWSLWPRHQPHRIWDDLINFLQSLPHSQLYFVLVGSVLLLVCSGQRQKKRANQLFRQKRVKKRSLVWEGH